MHGVIGLNEVEKVHFIPRDEWGGGRVASLFILSLGSLFIPLAAVFVNIDAFRFFVIVAVNEIESDFAEDLFCHRYVAKTAGLVARSDGHARV